MSSTEQDLRDLLADRSAAAPTAPERLTQVQRRVRRRRRRELATAAAAVCLVAVAVIVFAGGGLHRAGPLPPTHPSPTSSPSVLARDPFLTDADVGGAVAPWRAGLVRVAGAAPPRLDPCLTDPRTWGAVEARAATYRGPGSPPMRGNEFVLRFADPAAAHRALLAAWTRLTSCRRLSGHDLVRTPQRGLGASFDDAFVDQWGRRDVRIARAGTVLVVIEEDAILTDGSGALPFIAMLRAVPQYPASHPGCSIGATTC